MIVLYCTFCSLSYVTAEEHERFQIFKNNMKIARYVQLYDLGTATYGASPFADLTGW